MHGRRCLTTAVLSAALLLGALPAYVDDGGQSEASPAASGLAQLADMSLEDLTNVEISSVSKRKERQQVAAAAIYVITHEDIARATATSVPDLLRTVPGLHVARLDANKWSVSSRGFSGRYANSLLVLIDGRSVYTPFFSGTYWETRDVLLEDVDRIEIIRGPGGTLWGANAVNGVINIVTRDAADTTGGLVTAGGGTEEQAFGALRYGDQMGDHGAYRLYLKYADHDNGEFESGREARDHWDATRAGARFDWQWSDTHLTIQGDVYGVSTSQTYEVPTLYVPFSYLQDESSFFSGGNILARWTRTYESGGEISIQGYYDRSDSNLFTIDEERDTLDVELQYRFAPRGRHELMVGAGFRYTDERTEGTDLVSVNPERWQTRLFSAFVQDRIALIEDKLVLTAGTKIEHNDFTGLEIQPSARLAWTPNDRHTLWAAVSRAVRTPAIVEHGGRIASQALPFLIISLFGDDDFDSEELLSFEAGYRVRPAENLFLDVTLFANEYDHLRSLEFGLPFLEPYPTPVHFALPTRVRNNMSGNTHGIELALDWQPRPWWRARLSYTYLEMDLHIDAETLDILSESMEDGSPEQQIYVGNHFDLSDDVSLDIDLRYVDSLPALQVKNYLTMDARIGWQPSDDFELSIVAHDLLDSEHTEFGSMFVDTLPSQVQRGIYGKVSWKF